MELTDDHYKLLQHFQDNGGTLSYQDICSIGPKGVFWNRHDIRRLLGELSDVDLLQRKKLGIHSLTEKGRVALDQKVIQDKIRQAEQNENPKPKDQRQKAETIVKWVTGGSLVGIVALIISFKTCGYSKKSLKNSDSSLTIQSQQNNRTKQQDERSQRADKPKFRVDDFDFFVEPGQPIQLRCKVINLGNATIEISHLTHIIEIAGESPPHFDEISDPDFLPMGIAPTEVNQTYPLAVRYAQPEGVPNYSNDTINAFKKGKLYLYYALNFIYKNTLTEKYSQYQYEVRLYPQKFHRDIISRNVRISDHVRQTMFSPNGGIVFTPPDSLFEDDPPLSNFY